MCGEKPNYVCRATLFGGTKNQIEQVSKYFYEEI